MKKIVCELCSGSDFVKSDGVFMCQTCGTKYTLEEAKKLMGIPAEPKQTSSPVVSDSRFDNYMKLLNSSLQSNNYMEAEKYCNKILEIQPDNYFAWLKKGLCAAWLSRFDNFRFNEVINCLETAIKNVDEVEVESVKAEAVSIMEQMVSGFMNTACMGISQGYFDNLAGVNMMVACLYQQAIPFIESCSQKSINLLKTCGDAILNTAQATFNSVRFHSFNQVENGSEQWCSDGTGVCLTLLDIYLDMEYVSKADKKKALQFKIEICQAYLETYPVVNVILDRDPLVEYYEEIIRDARRRIRQLAPPKPKTPAKPKSTNDKAPVKKKAPTKKASVQANVELTWENVLVYDDSNNLPSNLTFVDTVVKSSLWGGVATEYGIERAIKKIRKEAAKRGCGYILITYIDLSFTPQVTAYIYRK